MGDGDNQEQGSSAFEGEAEEEGSDQEEVMYEDDILEEIEDNALPENGLHLQSCSCCSHCVRHYRVFVAHMQGWVLRWRSLT